MGVLGQQTEEDGHASHQGNEVTASTPQAWTLDGERIALRLDSSVYSVPAVLRAAYKLTDRAYFFLSREESDLWVTITAKPQQELTPVVGDFTNELTDQQLREALQKEFGTVQALIVAQAFSP